MLGSPLCARPVPSGWLAAKVLASVTPPSASQLRKEEATGERRGETIFFLVAAKIRSLGPCNPSESSFCCRLAFVPVAGVCVSTQIVSYLKALICSRLFFTSDIAEHRVGSSWRINTSITLQCSHLGDLTAFSTLDCCNVEYGRGFGGVKFARFQTQVIRGCRFVSES